MCTRTRADANLSGVQSHYRASERAGHLHPSARNRSYRRRDDPDRARRAGYSVDDGRGRRRRVSAAADHQLIILDVVGPGHDRRRRLPRAARRARGRGDAGALHQPDRRRRGADQLPRGRRGRRHRPAVRRPRARGPPGGAAASVPAVARRSPAPVHRRRATSRPARHRGVQPKGRRGHDDDRSQPGDAREPAPPEPHDPRRPRPAVRAGRDAPQPASSTTRWPTWRATRKRCATSSCLRTYVEPHDNGLQVIGAAGSPELAQLVTARHVERLLPTLDHGLRRGRSLDAGSQLDERTLAIFEQAECIVIPLDRGDRCAEGGPHDCSTT